jgi:ATP/maltotriose-dependent transcriptional regulator MalT
MSATPRSLPTYQHSRDVPRSVGAAAEAVLSARGQPRKLMAIFENSQVPMVMVDSARRYAEVNRPAQLALRLSLDEMDTGAIDEVTPDDLRRVVKGAWARLLDTGCVAGHYQATASDRGRLDIAYCGLASVLPGLHLIAFAPAYRLAHELEALEEDDSCPDGTLTPRETEVLALAAEGLSGPELAAELVLSPTTVNTHFKNIYAKLGVRTRAAAVAKAMRLGVID